MLEGQVVACHSFHLKEYGPMNMIELIQGQLLVLSVLHRSDCTYLLIMLTLFHSLVPSCAHMLYQLLCAPAAFTVTLMARFSMYKSVDNITYSTKFYLNGLAAGI